MRGPILTLDIATNTGVALGEPGAGLPDLSTVRFGEAGASLEASFAQAIAWAEDRLLLWKPRLIVFEAPMAPSFVRGHTNANTIRKLMGLAAVIGGMAHRLGFYNIAEAEVSDIREHFLGKRKIRRSEAKAQTLRRCREIGLKPKNDNEADAAALWFFTAGEYSAIPTLPLARPGMRKITQMRTR
jgi:hypothetical protein